MAARHLQPSEGPRSSPPDSPQAAAGDARPPASGAGVRVPPRWCRDAAGDAHVPSCGAARVLPEPAGCSHPGIPRHSGLLPRPSPPRGTNTKLPAAAPLPSDGSYLGAVVGALARRFSSAPDSSADLPGRRRWPPRSLRVTQFSLGPRQLGVRQRRAGVHAQRRRGGRPRVRASAGGRGGSAPSWGRLVLAIVSSHTPSLGPVGCLRVKALAVQYTPELDSCEPRGGRRALTPANCQRWHMLPLT